MTIPIRATVTSNREGAALILVLAFIVLLTALLIVYLSYTSSERQLASSSFTGAKSDQLAMSALNIIAGDLKQEIVNGSTPLVGSSGSETNYIPVNNANCMPATNAFVNVSVMPNLIRVSKYQDVTGAPTPTAPLVGSRASNLSSSSSPSENGKIISLKRWNKHFLLPRATANVGSTTFDSTPTGTFVAPDWVYVTTQGPQDVTSAGRTTLSTVLGRYAYAIYDEGGILNVNVAGYPASGTTAYQASGKPNISCADLTQLTNGVPTVTAAQIATVANDLVGWRNYASAQPGGTFPAFTFTSASATSYFNAASTNSTTGFSQTYTNAPAYNGHTDQVFLTRQQLLDYWSAAGFVPDLLQYFGTFSRDSNTTPTYSPLYDAPTLGGSGSYAYKSNADSTSSPPTNPDFLNWRFTAPTTLTVYDLYGNASTALAKLGDPIVRTRFPLGRLNWLTYQGPSGSIANAAAAIKQYFGLTWGIGANGYSCWIYTSPTGSVSSLPTAIKTLSQVAAANREPDFFELLQAGILNGSLGLDGGTASTGSTAGPAGETHLYDQSKGYQVLQIGANIIDQNDSDNYPTEISAQFNVGTAPGTASGMQSVYGVENLPYLYGMYLALFRYQSNYQNVGAWFIPEIWNPHQQPTTAATPSPTQFRIIASGQASMQIFAPTQNDPNYYGLSPTPLPHIYGPTTTLDSDSGITFTSAVTATEPTLLTQSNAAAASSSDKIATLQATFTTGFGSSSTTPKTGPGLSGPYTSNAASLLGLFCGSALDPDASDTTTNIAHYIDGTLTPSGVTFFVQYKDANGKWRTYSQLKSLLNSNHSASFGDLYNGTGDTYLALRSDPRTDRFSASEQYESYGGTPGASTGYGLPNKTTWVNAALNGEAFTWFDPSPGNFVYSGSGAAPSGDANGWANLWQLAENRNPPTLTGPSSGTMYYTDPDGIYRRADGAFAIKSGNPSLAKDGIPLITANTNSRPVVLNRPFRNVGELGYTFRDEPWKHIDFFTPESADAGLLDLFSIDDGNMDSMTAGRVSLNTRQLPVLEALLSGATQIEPITGALTTISPVDAKTIAAAIFSSSVTAPFRNRAELVTRFTSSNDTDTRSFISTLTRLPFSSTASPNPNVIKIQREGMVRALAESTTTRTWSLMIDVIAQSGHCTGSSPGQFVVDGERRYWLHIAIDRYTGRVIDRILEPVYE